MASKPGNTRKGVKERSASAGASAVADTRLRTDVLLNPDTASCEIYHKYADDTNDIRPDDVAPTNTFTMGNTKVCLIFDETPETLKSDKDRVEIVVQTNEKTDRIVATKINQRTFCFSAPKNHEGDASVVVFVNGTEVASSYLRYRSDTVHLVSGLSQIYLQFLSTVCCYMYSLQMKHQIQSPIPELDRLLAETFEDKDNKHNIPAKAFEELFDSLRHSSSDVVQSMCDLPTLLHLGGEFGLEHLVTRLMNLPGAKTASNLFNHNGRTASELAHDNGYLKLAKVLNTPMKMNSNLVDVKNPLNTPASGSTVNSILSNDLHLQQDEEDDYTLLTDATSPTDCDRSPDIYPQRQQPSAMVAPRKPPPEPCQKFLQHKMLSRSIPESLPSLPLRPSRASSGGTAPPPPPLRVSRDSGVNVDDGDAPGPPTPSPVRKRPPLTRGDSDPVFV